MCCKYLILSPDPSVLPPLWPRVLRLGCTPLTVEEVGEMAAERTRLPNSILSLLLKSFYILPPLSMRLLCCHSKTTRSTLLHRVRGPPPSGPSVLRKSAGCLRAPRVNSQSRPSSFTGLPCSQAFQAQRLRVGCGVRLSSHPSVLAQLCDLRQIPDLFEPPFLPQLDGDNTSAQLYTKQHV